ncbi:MAG: hypothetical protein BMS9Abin13_104 [Patescibacteria group bacterium]|nr:MAG: hypothetical protein BMS9Abin13_104 [Patescibacteria group bacterium]
MVETNEKKGFTLLELLIVISIIAILAVIIILILNPAETLRKARDVQRMSDMATMKIAIGIIVTASSTPWLSGTSGNSLCYGGSGTDSIWYSLSSTDGVIIDTTLDGGTGSIPNSVQVTSTNLNLTDGNGWIPVNFGWLPGRSPISNLPVDPINTIGTLSSVDNYDLVYRYVCNSTDTTFEIDAVLESISFTSNDNKMATDGGDNSNYYEVGTALDILGTGVNF